MCESTVVKELPETSIWHGAISDEDVALVRRRHAEKVEEWLDFADFVTELNALHEKYGIEKGEEGYFAYRKHLRTSYYQKLYTYGPTPDPLDEGCDCVFCRMHADESPDETECEVITETVVHSTASGECELPEAMLEQQGTQQKSKARRLGQVPAESPIDVASQDNQSHLPESASNAMTKPGSKKLGPVPAYEKIEATPETESVEPYDEEYERVAGDTSRYDSVGGVEPDWKNSEKIKPGPIVPVYPLNPSPPPSPYSKARRLGQVPAEPPTDVASQDNQSPLPKSATSAIIKPGSKKLGPVPAYEKNDDEIETPPPYSKKSRLGQVPAEPRIDSELRSDHSPVPKSASNAITKPGSEKLGLVPAYVKTAGEKAWLKKMSGSVF